MILAHKLKYMLNILYLFVTVSDRANVCSVGGSKIILACGV